MDAYVPRDMQPSFLYIVDKLNRFPYSKGWNRRTVRTAGYGPQMNTAFWLLSVYERLFYCGTKLEDVILRRLEPEVLDYIKGTLVNFMSGFSYLYAAEIDRGNRAVIGALNDLIYSENNKMCIRDRSTTPEDFAEIYRDFGYGEAYSRDSSSLSYV